MGGARNVNVQLSGHRAADRFRPDRPQRKGILLSFRVSSSVLVVFAVLAALILARAPQAFAGTATAKKAGATLSMTNEKEVARVKLVGLASTAPCAHLSLELTVEWSGSKGRAFAVTSTCSRDSRQVWRFNRKEPNGNLVKVACKGLVRSSKARLASVVIPRSCMPGAGGQLRARAVVGGAASFEIGPTSYARVD